MSAFNPFRDTQVSQYETFADSGFSDVDATSDEMETAAWDPHTHMSGPDNSDLGEVELRGVLRQAVAYLPLYVTAGIFVIPFLFRWIGWLPAMCTLLAAGALSSFSQVLMLYLVDTVAFDDLRAAVEITFGAYVLFLSDAMTFVWLVMHSVLSVSFGADLLSTLLEAWLHTPDANNTASGEDQLRRVPPIPALVLLILCIIMPMLLLYNIKCHKKNVTRTVVVHRTGASIPSENSRSRCWRWFICRTNPFRTAFAKSTVPLLFVYGLLTIVPLCCIGLYGTLCTTDQRTSSPEEGVSLPPGPCLSSIFSWIFDKDILVGDASVSSVMSALCVCFAVFLPEPNQLFKVFKRTVSPLPYRVWPYRSIIIAIATCLGLCIMVGFTFSVLLLDSTQPNALMNLSPWKDPHGNSENENQLVAYYEGNESVGVDRTTWMIGLQGVQVLYVWYGFRVLMLVFLCVNVVQQVASIKRSLYILVAVAPRAGRRFQINSSSGTMWLIAGLAMVWLLIGVFTTNGNEWKAMKIMMILWGLVYGVLMPAGMCLLIERGTQIFDVRPELHKSVRYVCWALLLIVGGLVLLSLFSWVVAFI